MKTGTAISREVFGEQDLNFVDLAASCGRDLPRLPWVMRILLENVVRCGTVDEADSARAAASGWLARGTSETEIAFLPGRILMHDTTCGPALVDIAALRSAVHEAGGDPDTIHPRLPVDVSTDHSLAVDHFGSKDAAVLNMRRELERNRERYGLMKWASRTLRSVRVHPPGTGIMHTLNLEQLATVVTTEIRNGVAWAAPDTLIGTDSHTPMINGLGVLGWGVGGLEAEGAMFGVPVSLRLPDVVGVRLSGRLAEGVLATDLALAVTARLRSIDVTGAFVEFFGQGVSTLSVGDRAVVANMAPEYGATTGYFPIDAAVPVYLAATGRSARHCGMVESYSRAAGLWFDPAAEPRYTRVVDLDLAAIETSLAGPHRPQDRIAAATTRQAMGATASPTGVALASTVEPRWPVVIAAITSCTNTSDPRLLVAAGLLAGKARIFGLKPPAWVKTSLAPGSPSAGAMLARSGTLDDLAALGFDIVGHGCTTCIGNSGPLTSAANQAIKSGARVVAVLSGNRNFPGRVHGDVQDAFLASPPMVVAFAIAGDVDRDIMRDPIGYAADGRPVRLTDVWPSSGEIDAALAGAANAGDVRVAFDAASVSKTWDDLQAPMGQVFPWDAQSTYIRRPPFVARPEVRPTQLMAAPLLVVGDDITTDHISPAGQIPARSEAASYLIANGASAADLNVFAARRGNWEVMLRGMFSNRAVRNLLARDLPAGATVHGPSGHIEPIWRTAERYKAEGTPVVVIAGERYGMGSSRDWAAKGLALLGVRAVLASSFERIHRSNLIGMGILPLCLPPDRHPSTLRFSTQDRLMVDVDVRQMTPRALLPVHIQRVDGRDELFECRVGVETALEIELLAAGGMLPLILLRAGV